MTSEWTMEFLDAKGIDAAFAEDVGQRIDLVMRTQTRRQRLEA